ncbi:hypothetical protein DCS_05636 [Drechmeria coniospora]|uniref:Uncharacterized protein n=1 Tax=Drechmeria coniospora TaxID=98403 RepID=A0A151GND6_DRECN|nr:hypothetical protein DCS_05636 [Drechmeria coniospora]KYK58619.1 hypothetical protein DCS_05636 [Drechmeria coniospora]ODA83983.1 hypothetical protein RJ55_02501 [Drechmeria coniospora]
MTPPLRLFAAARPQRLRQSSSTFSTPEPLGDGEEQPSSPRPRFRLKRRNVSHLTAPTQQFLASVAAADVPVPSIEEPQVLDDDDMLDAAIYPRLPHFALSHLDHVAFQEQTSRHQPLAFALPKTPAPRDIPSISPRCFPDWSVDGSFGSLESSPDCESSRPSTARSTQTSASVFSQYSLTSDLSQCASPEHGHGHADRFGPLLSAHRVDGTLDGHPAPSSRKAPWTKAMSNHVWAVYVMYLQDPKVSPFRIGKSGIPPSGVCMRVARQVKRSWKGSRPQSQANDDGRDGSATPTAEATVPFVEWPHTCAATRAHLRDLCKANGGGGPVRHALRLPRSATPTTARFRNRQPAPLRSASVFSASDMAMSLAVSTSDSMQPQGPLARLSTTSRTASASTATPDVFAGAGPNPTPGARQLAMASQPRLGSPFTARSYGPSSSNTLDDGFERAAEPQRQSRTVGTRLSLGSPVRLGGSRPCTQKRPSCPSVWEPRKSKRPSLGSDFWTDPSSATDDPSGLEPAAAEFCSTNSSQRDSLFVPRVNVQELFEASHPPSAPPRATAASLNSLTAPIAAPPRLGSPFAGKSQSFSFPARHSNMSMADFAAARRPFSTVHQLEGSSARPRRLSLANRLAYIDERLKDLRRRGPHERRSHSPV